MRLLSPKTLQIVAEQCTDEDFIGATSSRKQVLSHAWSEILKFKGSGQNHPKMFILDDYHLGHYARLVNMYGSRIGCNMNIEHLMKYDELYIGFVEFDALDLKRLLDQYFDDNYLFSDAVSLYFKGLNIFPYIFSDEWKKYCPVISIKEIKRQVDKTLSKGEK